MKKWHSIVIAFVLLAVLIGAYLYIKSKPQQPEQESSSEEQTIQLSEFDSNSINKIEIVNTNGTITINRQDSNWILNNRNDITASQSTINNIVDIICSINANLIVAENVDDLSIYGLDNPKKVIVSLSDGKSYTFFAGNDSPTGEGIYFINDTDTKVYMVGNQYKNTFNYTFNDLIEKDKIPTITTENLNYVYIHQKGKEPIEIVKPDETNKYNTWNSMATWEIRQPYNPIRALSVNEQWDVLLSQMTDFNSAVKEFVSSNPEDLSEYGLAEPEVEIWLRDSDSIQTHLYFGMQSDDTIYFRQADSNNIYTMSKSAIDAFMNINLFDIMDKFTALLNIEDVTKIVVQNGEEKYQFDLNVSKQKQEGSEKEVTVISCKVGDKEYPEADFKKLYQNFISILIDAQYNGEIMSGTPDIVLSFYMNDGNVVESKYYKYDDKYYIFDRDGTQSFLVDKRQFNSIFEKINDFFNGTINQNN